MPMASIVDRDRWDMVSILEGWLERTAASEERVGAGFTEQRVEAGSTEVVAFTVGEAASGDIVHHGTVG